LSGIYINSSILYCYEKWAMGRFATHTRMRQTEPSTSGARPRPVDTNAAPFKGFLYCYILF